MGSPADLITVDADELTALRAIAAAALPWYRGQLSGLDLQATVRQYLPLLDPDPGLRLAWPEADDEREPVAGVDYLPADGWTYERDDPADDAEPIRPGVDGWLPAPNWPEYRGVAA